MLTSETDMAFADGGIKQEGNTVDPVSGNEVPPGAMQEEVRDDVDAKLSVGEFVFPADVVRYVGLSTLMKLRDKAKVGLKRMEEIGQMGNAEEVKDGEALHSDGGDDEAFGSEIDSILSEEGGDEEEQKFDQGGYVNPSSETKYKNAPIRGFEMVAMTNAEGRVIYIPHVNGKPQLPVPAGYKVKATGVAAAVEEAASAVAAPTDAQGGGTFDGAATDGQGGPAPTGGGATAVGTSLSGGQAQAAMAVAGAMGIPGATMASLSSSAGNFVANAINSITTSMAISANQSNMANQMGLTSAQAGTTIGQAAVASGIDSENQFNEGTITATTGASGTGGAAAAAAAATATAAIAAGMSDSAVGQASQAAANAVMGGSTQSEAIAIGLAAGATASGGDVGVPSGGGLGFSTGPVGGGVTVGGPIGDQGAFGTTIGPAPTSDSVAPADGGAATGGGGDGGGGIPGGDGTSGIGGIAFAKGGFVSKKKSTKSTGLASRRK